MKKIINKLNNIIKKIPLCPSKKNKNILFVDFNGVISYNPFWASLKKPSSAMHYLSKPIETFLFKNNFDLVVGWLKGKYTTEQIHDFLEKGMKIKFNKNELLKIFADDCAKIDISKKIMNELKQLKKHFKIVLMTDNMDTLNRFTIPNNPILNEVFDCIVNSYDLKMCKRDNNCKAFVDIVKKFNASAPHSFLIDDSPKNCDAFEKDLNAKAYCTKTEKDVLLVLKILNR